MTKSVRASRASSPPHERPSFSAVIPTYQRGKTIARAIESALAQSFPAEEIIVVDDGSTDETQDALSGFSSVRTIRQARGGSAAARNRGVQAAAATWIAFLDSDDRWDADHLERLAAAIENTDGAADLYFDDTVAVMYTFREDDGGVHVGSLWEYARFAPPERVTLLDDATDCVLLPVQPMMLQSSAIRREAYLGLGGMCSRLSLRHDTHLFLLLGLGRPACAVSGIGARMTDEGGEDRLTRSVTPASKPYWDETALLYDDVVRRVRPGSAAHHVLVERAAVAHWRRARHELSAGRLRAAARPLARALRLRPRLVVERTWAGLSRGQR